MLLQIKVSAPGSRLAKEGQRKPGREIHAKGQSAGEAERGDRRQAVPLTQRRGGEKSDDRVFLLISIKKQTTAVPVLLFPHLRGSAAKKGTFAP